MGTNNQKIIETYKIFFLSFRSFLQFSTSHNLMIHSRLYPDRYTSKNCSIYTQHKTFPPYTQHNTLPPLQTHYQFLEKFATFHIL